MCVNICCREDAWTFQTRIIFGLLLEQPPVRQQNWLMAQIGVNFGYDVKAQMYKIFSENYKTQNTFGIQQMFVQAPISAELDCWMYGLDNKKETGVRSILMKPDSKLYFYCVR